MALQDVINKIRLENGNSDAFNVKAIQTLTNLYNNGGSEARAMLDGIAADAKTYVVQDGNNVAGSDVQRNSITNELIHFVEIDFDWVETEGLYVSSTGEAVNFSAEAMLAHELKHLLS
jgi:hypothetical protein